MSESATAREIAQQPALWAQIGRQVADDAGLAAFLGPKLAERDFRIVLTGAGTSAFIGRCLAPVLSRERRTLVEAIPTTDIVADPAGTLTADAPTLMVHFARSGNSPESVAALDLADQCIARCAHLVITCNADGALHRRTANRRCAYSVVLPEACNDRAFAMTSSFTGMLVAAAVALRAMPADAATLDRLAGLGRHVLDTCEPLLSELVRGGFERAIFLGARELHGLACEASLKMLELTDGRVVSLAESPLAFRHGPKSIVDSRTLVVHFLSDDPHAHRYDLDLLAELRRDAVAARVMALAGVLPAPAHRDTLVLGAPPGVPAGDASASDLVPSLAYIVFAQWLALLRSSSLGITPDTPNAAGTVNRVVQGVSIHPWAPRA